MRRSMKYVLGSSSLLMFLMCHAMLPQSLQAQSAGNTGQIVGLVVDPTLAPVAGTDVIVRNKNINFTQSTLTDAAGRFTFPLLSLGPYAITTRANGFEPATQEAAVMLGSTVTATFKLNVGINREAIEVNADILPSDTTVAASRAVLTNVQLRHLPLNGGRVQNLIWNMPTGQIEPE